MKKLATIKKCGLTALIAVLCLAIMITCFSFVMPFKAVADEEPDTDTDDSVSTAVTIAENISIEENVEYGKSFTVPQGAKVTAPNGDNVQPADGKYTANQIGNYTVECTESGVTYKYYVKSRLDKEYFLRVDANGADIPSYIQYGEDSTFELPAAHVYYYDDDNILREYPKAANGSAGYTVKVLDSRYSDKVYRPNLSSVEDKTFVASHENAGKNGKVYLTYVATLDNGDGDNINAKRLTQTFTVNVQASVPSGGNPTLSVSGVQKDVSVNRAVTLPVATATDTYDDNVKVEITVKTPSGENVRNVLIDDDGYAYAYTEDEDDYVVFDNDKAMTFYPRELGSYEVKYVAYNDSYDKNDPNSSGKSSERVYYITVSDLVAPVFKEVDEYLIPETWGMNVYGANSASAIEELSGKIHFTVPTVVDNKDTADYDSLDEDHADDKISVYFRITDSDNSKTILEFTNILANDDKDNKATVDTSVYDDENPVFSLTDGFTFDFSKYKKKNGSLPGTYTVLYRARDKANNTSSKTYTITLQDEYKDEAAPTTAEVKVDNYLSATEDTLTIPYPEYADASDSRPKVDYRIYTDATDLGDDAEYVTVKGGEVADIENGYLIIDKDKQAEQRLKLGDNLYFYVGVTDKVGNFKSNCIENKESINLDDEDAVGKYLLIEAKMTVLDDVVNEFVYDEKNAETISFNKVLVGDDSDTTIKAGNTVNAGWFKVTNINADMRDYTGFEVAVYDPQGNPLNVTLETVSTIEEDGTATLYVQNIKFNASVATDEGEHYTMLVRIFDVNGNNSIYGYTLNNVEPADDDTTTTSAIAAIGSTGNVNVKYKLNNEVIKGIVGTGTYRVVRQISGGVFSVMGSEFVAKTQGNYTVKDGYIDDELITGSGDYAFDYDEVQYASANKGVYNFSITDEAAPIIEVMGDMPTYWEKYVTGEGLNPTPVQLPIVIAYTDNGIATVDVDVKDPDSGKVEYDKEARTFKATKDGVYTVTYTATYANAEPATATYTINVGDIDAPEFTLISGTGSSVTTTYKVGDTFTFANMALSDEENEDKSNIKIVKKLIDPSKEEVTDATVDGYFSSNWDKANNGTDIVFSMAGDYEVVYTATDEAGNPYTLRYTITVVSSGSSTPTTWTTLSTVLIIVAVVLLAGVIVYVVRFRKVKK